MPTGDAVTMQRKPEIMMARGMDVIRFPIKHNVGYEKCDEIFCAWYRVKLKFL
jgi:hypothetical protein